MSTLASVLVRSAIAIAFSAAAVGLLDISPEHIGWLRYIAGIVCIGMAAFIVQPLGANTWKSWSRK